MAILCGVSWVLDIIAVGTFFGLNAIGIFWRRLREEFGIPKNVVQTILAGYLIYSIIFCRPF